MGMTDQVSIRDAKMADFDGVISLDEVVTRQKKTAYWSGIFSRHINREENDRYFLVAETGGTLVGFIVGEVRAWEFGSAPCGWVFAVEVSPKVRELGIGQRLFEEICLRLKQAGITMVRTMMDRDDKLTLSFFRAQGMRTGQYVELGKQIE
jgi:GNAT superfamily N-acetyltransferase